LGKRGKKKNRVKKETSKRGKTALGTVAFSLYIIEG
jgi:hypothetical protein